ncbi:MAG TPA: tyrosine--tRNA ligase [Candidatus Binatus sp.]|uniref:tyrosine--tRNA ligase n=1 Tax=Candidatus Binatus sp. TaxID=2811406 RepID=UPI002B4A5726|nr:tyrosine--tRNA ligase [Candidatus Binatus sp.]HKN13367.1 tyrosine--tRNA ligase [Candidatus Binatus sp.]
MNENQANEQAAALARGATEVISPAELAAKIALGRPLRIKLGMDPTAPDLHLGHSLTLKKMRDFQNAGHTVIFLVGDFTAMIGDPTGRNEARKPLSRDQIERNAETYRAQAFKILDRDLTEVRFNSEWMNELGVRRLIEIAAKVSVARLLERDDFEKRLAAEEPLFLHELLYPVIQGYDSVALQADLEIGGTDQKFNMLVGRELQRHFGQAPQAVMTMPLLEGLDGVRKMSKSYGNYVGLTDKPEDMYGKLMSVPDRLMVRYYELLTTATSEEIAAVRSGGLHPMEAKKRLARTLVTEYHGAPAATRAEEYFESKHQRREVPASAQVYRIAEDLWICELIKQLQFTPSTSEARRLVSQGAVRVDGRTITDVNFRFVPGEHKVLEVGKRRVARIEP